jgi:hypothetical protein
MKWMEQLNKSEIPKNYQEAFKGIANALIFNESVDINISKDSIKSISQKIQQEYLALDEGVQIKRREDMDTLLDGMIEKFQETYDEKIDKPKIYEENFSYINSDHMKMPEEEFIKYANDIPRFYSAYDDGVKYYQWGFTPKLSKEAKGLDVGKNCFGTTVFVGSLCKKRGLNIDMGVTPDHPYVVAYLSDGIYALDGMSEVKKLDGIFEDHGDYKIYKTEEKDKILSKMLIIQNFDDSVLYETLENIEVLRQISLGNKDISLPGNYDEGLIIANKNKDLIEKINWKDLQNKLLPKIDKSFSDNKDEWMSEVSRVALERKKMYIEKIFLDIARKAQEKTSYHGQDFKESQKTLGPLFKKYNESIIQFLTHGTLFEEGTPDDVKNYFSYVKTELEKQKEDGISLKIIEFIESKLIDKTAKES